MSEKKEIYYLPDDAKERLKKIVRLKHELAWERADFLHDIGMELVLQPQFTNLQFFQRK